MRSRKKQFTINYREVHQRVGAVVQEHVQLQDYGYKCRASVLLNILFFAVSRITSIFAACRNLGVVPTQQTVFNALIATLPDEDELARRLNAALADDLPKAVRKRSPIMAMDLTLIPYHGEPFRDRREIYRGQPKSGTTHFHAYATCYVVFHGHRFTLALTPVKYGEPMEDVVSRLLRLVRKIGVKCRLLLLDRGFYSVAVIRYLQAAHCPFLMPVAHRGRKPKAGDLTGSTRAFTHWKHSGYAEHTMRAADQNHWAKSATVRICVSHKSEATARKSRSHKTLVYAFWGFRPPGTRWIRETYRRRFGIETSYRQMNQARIRTCTRSPILRLFFFGLAMVLRNVWVWFHLTILATWQKGRLVLHLERLPFRDLTLCLQRVAEISLGIIQLLMSQLTGNSQLAFR
jgi:hypothetical protein